MPPEPTPEKQPPSMAERGRLGGRASVEARRRKAKRGFVDALREACA
jgi:hypothetical protein